MSAWNLASNVWSSVTSQMFGHCTSDMHKNEHVLLRNGITAKKRIYLVTWNVHGCSPPEDLSDLLCINETPLPEIYAIGLQEVGNDDWESAFLSILRLEDYVKVKSRRLLGIVTMLFVKRNHLPFVSSIESEVTRTGFKGYWGNKGASSIRMDFMGMNLIIVNSHLAAHKEGIKDRIMNVDNILDFQKFRDPDTDNIMDHDYVFWIGDLNFRVENMSYNRTLDLIRKEDYETLRQNDQLRQVMDEGLLFEGFHEGQLNFPPTYKFDAGTDDYDTSTQQRIPSYTDRILYYFHDTAYGMLKLSAWNMQYRAHSNYRSSDHKPVSAVIGINVMSRANTSPVIFNVGLQPWKKSMDKEVFYTLRKPFTPSIKDWIGIYKADFVEFNSYVSYIWAAANSTRQRASDSSSKMAVQFNKAHLNDLPNGQYVLCYLARKDSLWGISKTFTITS